MGATNGPDLVWNGYKEEKIWDSFQEMQMRKLL